MVFTEEEWSLSFDWASAESCGRVGIVLTKLRGERINNEAKYEVLILG